jgi:hypothetical protein
LKKTDAIFRYTKFWSLITFWWQSPTRAMLGEKSSSTYLQRSSFFLSLRVGREMKGQQSEAFLTFKDMWQCEGYSLWGFHPRRGVCVAVT